MNTKTTIFLFLIIVLVGFLSYIGLFGLTFEGKESDFYVPVVTGDNASAYENSCNEINFSQISKDPFALNGKKVKVTGQIYSRQEVIDFNKTRTHIILKVPELSPDPYIIVSYTSALPFKRGDNITVYGEYYYPAQEENGLSEIEDKNLPNISAGYIEKR